MPNEDTGSSEYLIQLLEKEARRDVREIDVAPEHEGQIDLPQVRVWYIETEKLIRVLANVLPSTMVQPINQLRYAGHHSLTKTLKWLGIDRFRDAITHAAMPGTPPTLLRTEYSSLCPYPLRAPGAHS